MAESTGVITDLLLAHARGDGEAFSLLVPLVYDDLRRIARRSIRRSGGARTIDTTGLVHEAYLKLVDQTRAGYRDRSHFFAVAARAMRQILVDEARRRFAGKRGGGVTAITLEEERHGGISADADWLLSLEEALESLARLDPRLPRVVECRFFAGLSEEETADALGVSTRTVQRDWMRAKAWLREEMGPPPPAPGAPPRAQV
ncbi:MAG TPA: ECF-type sigma factor [Thermoanaerobaculia bacterium]|nr:ECF-type sigma factor [Thermoanaerobaculia bacterium]